MKIKKIKEYRDLKNLTDVAKLFYLEELDPDKLASAFISVRIIADYEHNAVFLQTEQDFVNQKLLEERPDLFTKAYTDDHDDSLDDITLDVLNRYGNLMGDIETSILQKLESSILDAARSGQLNFLRRRRCDFIKSCDAISVADAEAENVALE